MNYKDSGDLSRLEWTLKDGATPFSRIYSTMKRLNSTMSKNDAQAMIDELVSQNRLSKEPHPFNQKEFFYKLAANQSG